MSTMLVTHPMCVFTSSLLLHACQGSLFPYLLKNKMKVCEARKEKDSKSSSCELLGVDDDAKSLTILTEEGRCDHRLPAW